LTLPDVSEEVHDVIVEFFDVPPRQAVTATVSAVVECAYFHPGVGERFAQA
jgi:hypothetical protein